MRLPKEALALWLHSESRLFSGSEKTLFFTSLYSSDIGTRGHFILLFYMHFLTLETWTGGGGHWPCWFVQDLGLSREKAFRC